MATFAERGSLGHHGTSVITITHSPILRWYVAGWLSPIIYVSGGLLWNREAGGRFGVGFGFARGDWPDPPIDRRLLPFVIVAIPLNCVAVLVLIAFVAWRMPWTSR